MTHISLTINSSYSAYALATAFSFSRAARYAGGVGSNGVVCVDKDGNDVDDVDVDKDVECESDGVAEVDGELDI